MSDNAFHGISHKIGQVEYADKPAEYKQHKAVTRW